MILNIDGNEFTGLDNRTLRSVFIDCKPMYEVRALVLERYMGMICRIESLVPLVDLLVEHNREVPLFLKINRLYLLTAN